MTKKALNKLVKLLALETLEENLFRGQSENIGGPRVFGGQVIGQACPMTCPPNTLGPPIFSLCPLKRFSSRVSNARSFTNLFNAFFVILTKLLFIPPRVVIWHIYRDFIRKFWRSFFKKRINALILFLKKDLQNFLIKSL